MAKTWRTLDRVKKGVQNVSRWNNPWLNYALMFAPEDPYTKYEGNFLQKAITGRHIQDALYDQDERLLKELSKTVEATGDSSLINWWNSQKPATQSALLDELYENSDNGFYNLWGLLGKNKVLNQDLFEQYINELSSVTPQPKRDFNYDDIYSEAKAAIGREDAEYLGSINDELARLGDAYTANRNALLTSQYQNNARTMDTMASEMSRARRNAIEAGASAGIRIAGNVNAVLSAQNKMSQTSLDTSNQLAQMLLSQRNAESGLHQQYRDYKAGSYDRIANRANAEYNRAENSYSDKMAAWQDNYDRKVSEDNPFTESNLKYKNRTAY